MPRKNNKKPFKKPFRKYTRKSNYRNSQPRTIQIATRRNKSQTLRFVTNQTYKVNPGGTVGGMENTWLSFRANSIYDIMYHNGGLNSTGTWVSQDSAEYGPTIHPNATGWAEWTHRYQHFTVLGAKVTATFEPIGVDDGLTQVPTTMYIGVAGEPNLMNAGTEMSQINKYPYFNRGSLVPGRQYSSTSQMSGQGVRLVKTYSTKKFEGVKDVADNAQLKGDFDGTQPDEKSYFYVGIRNTIPSGAANDRMPQGLMRIKVEYITKLSEPTESNQVQIQSLRNDSGIL